MIEIITLNVSGKASVRYIECSTCLKKSAAAGRTAITPLVQSYGRVKKAYAPPAYRGNPRFKINGIYRNGGRKPFERFSRETVRYAA